MMTNQTDIFETAKANSVFETVVKLIENADAEWILKSNGPFTFLAPTDEAFGKLPPDVLKELLDPASTKLAHAVLANHIYSVGVLTVDELFRPRSFHTWGTHVYTWPNSRELWLYDPDNPGSPAVRAKFVKEDMGCTNGLLHGLDTMLYVW